MPYLILSVTVSDEEWPILMKGHVLGLVFLDEDLSVTNRSACIGV
jgi:hypothetical protein